MNGNVRQALLGGFLSLLSALAIGQESLGEVMDQGGKPLSKQDLNLLVGSWIKWSNPNGMLDFQVQPNDGGSLQGSARGMRGLTGPLDGRWNITDDGRFCMSAKFQLGKQSGDFDRCSYWYRAGDNYWVSGSPGDRAAKVTKYVVSK